MIDTVPPRLPWNGACPQAQSLALHSHGRLAALGVARAVSALIGLAFMASALLGERGYGALPQAGTASREPLVRVADRLELGVWTELKAPLHPLQNLDASARYALHLVSEPMLVLDKSWQWQCRLCKTMPSVDNGHMEVVDDPNLAYGLKIDFQIAPQFKWGDGHPVTGNDVLFTWQVANASDGAFASKELFAQIEHIGVDPNNPRRFTLFFRKASFLLAQLGGLFLLPQHLEQPIWNEHKKEGVQAYLAASLYKTAPENPGLYNGLYGVHKRDEQGNLVLIRNKTRQGKQPQHVVLHALKTNPSKAANLDLVSEPACAELDCLTIASAQPGLDKRKASRLIYGDSTVFEHVDLNLRNPFLRDRNVRKALYYAIDKEKLLASLRPHELIPAVSPIHPAAPYFMPQVSYYPYEPATARDLLEQSRWALGPDGKVRVKNDKALRLTLTTSDEPMRLKVAQSLISDWAAIGVEVSLAVQGAKTFREETLAKMRYEALVLYAWDLPADTLWRPLFHSESIPNIRNHYQGQNISGWNSYKVDQLLHRLSGEVQVQKRQAFIHELQEQYTAALPGIPLYFRMQQAVLSPALEGFYIPGHQFPSSSRAAEWHLQGEGVATRPPEGKPAWHDTTL